MTSVDTAGRAREARTAGSVTEIAESGTRAAPNQHHTSPRSDLTRVGEGTGANLSPDPLYHTDRYRLMTPFKLQF